MTQTSNTSGRNTTLAIALLAVAIVAFFVMRKPAQDQGAAVPKAADSGGKVAFRMEQQWLIRLKLATAEEATMAPQIRSTGRVVPVPSNRAVVAPPVGGILQSGTMPRIGQNVSQGQSLATLVQTPSAAETAQLRIENTRIDAERRRLAQVEIEARARLDAASHDFERAKRLYEKKAYSQKALESEELDRTAAQSQLTAIQEQLKALQSPEAASSNYEVRAPLSGTIVSVNKSIGEQVAPGEPIVEIVALGTVWVEAPVFEKDLGRLSKNGLATFTTATFPEREFRGRLITIGAVIDEKSRAAIATFEVDNRSGDLRVGMQANLRLDGGEKISVLLIPKEAVVDNEGTKIVYVLLSGEEFERRTVTLGDEYGGRTAILSGLKAGERIVTQGAYQLKLQELRPADAGAHTHET